MVIFLIKRVNSKFMYIENTHFLFLTNYWTTYLLANKLPSNSYFQLLIFQTIRTLNYAESFGYFYATCRVHFLVILFYKIDEWSGFFVGSV